MIKRRLIIEVMRQCKSCEAPSQRQKQTLTTTPASFIFLKNYIVSTESKMFVSWVSLLMMLTCTVSGFCVDVEQVSSRLSEVVSLFSEEQSISKERKHG